MNWAAGLRATMMMEEKVRDAASAQTLKAEHEALKAEIEAREETFQAVVELGRLMVQENHYAATVRWQLTDMTCFLQLYITVVIVVECTWAQNVCLGMKHGLSHWKENVEA
jgi:hypothetical protein